MKTRYNLSFLIGFICMTLFSNCKRPIEDLPSDKGLIFGINGLDENSDSEDIITKGSHSNSDTTFNYYQKNAGAIDGLEYDLFIEEKAKRVPTKAVTTTRLANNTRFRVLLFNTDAQGNTTDFEAQGESNAASNLSLPVYRNKQYRWIAYSFNNSTEIPTLDPANPTLAIKATSTTAGTDLLYASGLIRTSDDGNAENRINITFKRMVSAIRYEIDARGAFTSIKELVMDFITSQTRGLRDGIFHVVNGSFTSTSIPPDFRLTNWDNVISDTIPTGWVKYKQFLTVPSSSPMNFVAVIRYITLTSQMINPDNPTTEIPVDRQFNTIESVTPLFYAPFNIASGKQYNIKMRLRESAVGYSGTYWARGNLTYNPNVDRNKYRIQYNNVLIKNINGGMNNFLERDYFDTRPPQQPQGNPSNWDPCQLVYPEKTWRLPTVIEATLLVGSTNYADRRRFSQPGNAGWYMHFENVAGMGEPRYPNRHLTFVAAGHRNKDRALVDFNYQSGNSNLPPFPIVYGDVGYFRTNDTSQFIVTRYRGGEWDFNLFMGVSEFNDRRAANVRCVRNN
ncbi:hypothetical protein PZ892_04390 [Sphingobacterium sp. WM]|uniref:fimbrillin family protein n=1 Tax=Sphingobacterium sp. WM TaxID=3031802 RepID=UPI00240D3A06|nr:fimbrillin family protein [Sphingobacterium sp. WM]WFB64450.1 hypothetical protein PZ892_04390 [Sphingobacterium sp. WM]